MVQRTSGTPSVPGTDGGPEQAPEPSPQAVPQAEPRAEPRRGLIERLMRRNRLLTEREAELRAREAELLDRMSTALERFGPEAADSDDLRHFREAREALAGLFLLVIAGEFNSGKNSFINALLGEK